MGLLKVAGIDTVASVQRPTVAVVPTGDELVQREAADDERVETTAFTIAQHVDRWGGKVTYRNTVAEDRHALRAAIQRDLTRDALVITGVGREDLVREVVADLGTVHVDTIAAEPGGTVAVASVEDRPVLLVPESPVDCLVAAVQLLRPLVAALAGSPLSAHPHHHAEMETAVESEQGTRTFVPVALADHVATPLGEGSPTLRDVTRADGWVSVDEDSAGLAVGDAVGVIDWEQA